MQRSYRHVIVTALVLLSILVVRTASATSPASADTSHADAGACARRVRRARRGRWDGLHHTTGQPRTRLQRRAV